MAMVGREALGAPPTGFSGSSSGYAPVAEAAGTSRDSLWRTLLSGAVSQRHLELPSRRLWRGRHTCVAAFCAVAASLLLLAVVPASVSGRAVGPIERAISLFKPQQPVSTLRNLISSTRSQAAGSCAPVGGQCGGEGYAGPECCEAPGLCKPKHLHASDSFMQCVTPTTTSRAHLHTGKERAPASSKHTAATAAAEEPPAASNETNETAAPTTLEEVFVGCSGLWAQCGGEKYHGPQCCEEPNVCMLNPLLDVPTYMQCRPPTTTVTTTLEPQCEDMQYRNDSPCQWKVNWDLSTGISTRPDLYPGLDTTSTFKDFQAFNAMLIAEQSHCPPPCGSGNCFLQFRYDGCDDHDLWNCEYDDGSLSYDCCCKKFDVGLRVNFTKAVVHHAKEKEDKKKNHKSGPTFFCVALMMPNGYEVGLLSEQLKKGVGMFGCDEWAVYSNASISLSPGSHNPVMQTVVMKGSVQSEKGGNWNTALNTGTFVRFWDKVLHDPRSFKHDWVVKLDPDCVFLPERFRQMITADVGPLAAGLPEAGVYLNNCFLGMHGPIEVLSRAALETYHKKKDLCMQGDPASHGQEDFWLRACMEEINVTRVDAFNLLMEGDWACQERPSAWQPYRPPCFAPQVAFHPFKSIDSYMHCWAEAVNANLPGWVIASAELPSAENQRHA